jgi:hypothetical protein
VLSSTFLRKVDRLLWAISGAFLGVYAVVQNLNIPLIVQPQLFTSLTLVSWGQVCMHFPRFFAPCYLRFIPTQCQYYGKKKSKTKSVTLVLASAVILGGFEAGMTFIVKVKTLTDVNLLP